MSKTFDIEEVLRSLRADGCHMWPNKYYMWTGKDGELVMVGLRSHLFWHILCYEEFANGKRKRRLSTSHRIVSMKTTPVPTIPSKDWVKESPGLNTLVNGRIRMK